MASGVSTRLTYEDYLELPNDGKRYEILDGELFVNPAPVPLHQIIVRQLLRAIQDYFDAHGGGEAIASPIDVVLAHDTVVQPDLVAVTASRLSIIGPKNVQGAPDLVIEVLSERTRQFDENTKRKLYEQSGVLEYWIVDPDRAQVKIHRGSEVFVIDQDGTIATPLFPELVLDLRNIFPE
ncbi:MAG TPA: Uma2 family endonuclease [Thermoanaerobaculia bacterium]